MTLNVTNQENGNRKAARLRSAGEKSVSCRHRVYPHLKNLHEPTFGLKMDIQF